MQLYIERYVYSKWVGLGRRGVRGAERVGWRSMSREWLTPRSRQGQLAHLLDLAEHPQEVEPGELLEVLHAPVPGGEEAGEQGRVGWDVLKAFRYSEMRARIFIIVQSWALKDNFCRRDDLRRRENWFLGLKSALETGFHPGVGRPTTIFKNPPQCLVSLSIVSKLCVVSF